MSPFRGQSTPPPRSEAAVPPARSEAAVPPARSEAAVPSARSEATVSPARPDTASPPASIPCPNCALDPLRALRPGSPEGRAQVTCPEDAAALVRDSLCGLDRERCLLVTLDTKHRLLGIDTVSVGTADHTFMAPREVYRDALLAGASAVFLAHNHPSGDPTPSADDRQITRRLAQAGATVGIDLLDHLVVGDPAWISLARLGVL